MFLLYIVSYLDRINVGFAALQMNRDLGLSPAVFGWGAGIFFVGYVLFEIPSNLILHRVGARRWIARIMISWGIVSAATMFIKGPVSFYTMRLLLGVAEAGFFPGMILYLTYWYPEHVRGRAIALFMTAAVIAGVVGGPISGALLTLHGAGGLAGWQWLFLIEGLPAVLLGVAVLAYLPNGPREASWLTAEERGWLTERLQREREQMERARRYTLAEVLVNPRIWLLALLYFAIVVGLYGTGFWLPQIIQGFGGLSDFAVGLVSAIPYLAAAIAMVQMGRHSDRTGERRWHVALSAFASAAGLALAAYLSAPLLSLAALTLAVVGIWGTVGPFWALPTAFLSGGAAAGGIALINSIGNVGGFVGPSLVGSIRAATGSFAGGMVGLAIALACAGGIVLVLPRMDKAGGERREARGVP